VWADSCDRCLPSKRKNVEGRRSTEDMDDNRYNSTDDEGVHTIGRIFNRKFEWIFREQPKSDMGIDAHVEICENRKPLGKLIGLQIKSGKSWFKEKVEVGFVYRGSRVHLEYWKNHLLPVVLVMYNPEDEQVYWQVIKEEHIALTKKGWKIVVPYEHKLDQSAIPVLLKFANNIFAKRPRNNARLFRGIDLGHDIDPTRSALAKVDPNLFKDIGRETLDRYKYHISHEESLAVSTLSSGISLGDGQVYVGVFFDHFMYTQQLFTEIGYGPNKNISAILGKEAYFSQGAELNPFIGPAGVVVHCLVKDIPIVEDILKFGQDMQAKSVNTIIFFINESVYETAYFGIVYSNLRQIGLRVILLFLEDISYQVLTTDIYWKYEAQLQWLYQTPL
jgi:hypothetical protein